MTASSVPPDDFVARGPADRTGPGSVPGRRAPRQPIFDGIRGLAALALLTVHVAFAASLVGSYTEPPSNAVGAFLVTGFQVAIGIFFVLSGLFLYRPFARSIIGGTPRPPLGPYLLRRVLRLLPPYYVMTAAALLLLNLSQIDGVWYVLRPVVLMQNYDPVPMIGMDISWTVPTEIQWYLALPVIAGLNAIWARRGADPATRARRLLLPVPILLVVGFLWFGYVHSPSMGIFPPEFWWPFGMAGSIGVGMALGVLSALTQVDPGSRPALFRLAARRQNAFWLAALVVFLVDCAKPFGRAGYGDYDNQAGGVVFYLLLVLFGALAVTPMIASSEPSRLIRAVAGNRVIVFLGRISYGVYLWHFVVMNLYLRNGSIFGETLMLNFLRGRAGFFELELAVLTGTIAIATVSYFLVERPIMAWGERVIAARRDKDRAPELGGRRVAQGTASA